MWLLITSVNAFFAIEFYGLGWGVSGVDRDRRQRVAVNYQCDTVVSKNQTRIVSRSASTEKGSCIIQDEASIFRTNFKNSRLPII